MNALARLVAIMAGATAGWITADDTVWRIDVLLVIAGR